MIYFIVNVEKAYDSEWEAAFWDGLDGWTSRKQIKEYASFDEAYKAWKRLYEGGIRDCLVFNEVSLKAEYGIDVSKQLRRDPRR